MTPKPPSHAPAPAAGRADAAAPPNTPGPAPVVDAHVIGAAADNEADPEQDVAPNLGGESQMQDA